MNARNKAIKEAAYIKMPLVCIRSDWVLSSGNRELWSAILLFQAELASPCVVSQLSRLQPKGRSEDCWRQIVQDFA